MKSLQENKYYIWLASITNISTAIKIQLLRKYGNPINIFNTTKEDIKKKLHIKNLINDKNAEEIQENIKIEFITNQIVNKKYKINLEKQIEILEKKNIKILTYEDKEYLRQLKNINDFPICLFCKGNIELLKRKNKIAIVGSRDYSQYGEKVATKIAYELSNKNITIVSGGARGIDSFAHKGCILAKKQTIIVLGNGLDYIYPPENKELQEEVLKNEGLIISEYPLGIKPSKYNFPARNRIISGISDGVLVVEAKEKSGALITVDFALEQGKNIYAIPGNINNKNSQGTNELIKQGAKLVTNINDILEDYILS